MTDLNRALTEIHLIRGQLARGAEFRGYGPTTIAATGVLALLVAAAQAHWLQRSDLDIGLYLAQWVATAAVSLLMICVEAIRRTQRMHSPLAMQMVHAALEQFVPAIVAGLFLTVVFWRCTPQSLWMLPGLWQVLFSMGVFASCRLLPRPMFAAGVWYLTTGLTCLILGKAQAFSPLTMGVPFCLGQLLVAGVLRFGYRNTDEDP